MAELRVPETYLPMRKAFLIIILSILCAASAVAQQGSIRAVIVDGDTSGPLPGAVIELAPTADTTQKHYSTSAYGGAVSTPSFGYGEYLMRVTFLGYENIERKVNINKAEVNLGTLRMKPDSRRIDAVSVEGQAMRTSIKGDTLSYNADAFKTTQDADAASLLSKLPGVTVSNGQVEAQGETVEKIFVDGKEFFGEDVNTTLKTIPAEVISRVEVYDKKSDQAEFSGVDDGEGFKAINLVTKMENGAFGKSYAIWGIDDKYSFGTNTNVFKGNHRLSVIAMANNVNQQNFSHEDILGAMGGGSGGPGQWHRMNSMMVPQMDGVSVAQSIGLNYSGTFKEKLEVTASYFFNNSDNDNDRETERWYTDGRPWEYDAWRTSETRNNEHRFRSRIDYKINDNHSLMLRTSASWQNYRSDTEGLGETYDVTNPLLPVFVRSDYTGNEMKRWGYSVNSSLIYRVKLGKPGRTMTFDVGGRISDNDMKSRMYTLSKVSGLADSEIDQKTNSDTKSYRLNGSVVYTEPLSQYMQITAEYRADYNYSDTDRLSYLWNGSFYQFASDYSNIYDSGYLTQRVGPGFNYSKERNTINFSVMYQHAKLINEYEYPYAYDLDRSFENLVYRGRLEHSFNSSTMLRVYTRSRTNNPSISQLQEVVDLSNKQFITAGNPDLEPSYNHNLWVNLMRSNVEKGTTFMIMGGFSLQSDYIGDYVITDPTSTSLPSGVTLDNGGQFSSYRNMSGYWYTHAGVNYGFPLKWLKSNMNTGLRAYYSETPGMINDHKNMLGQQEYTADLSLGSNISEKVDFTAMYSFGYKVADNSVGGRSTNEYYTQYASLGFKIVLPLDFTFSGSVAYTQERGITDDYNDEFTMCNLYVGKKVFRNRRGEIIFGVNDLFDQKTSFSRNVTTQYIENVRNNAIGRYFSLQFVFNLRTFGAPSGQGNGNSMRFPGGPPPRR